MISRLALAVAALGCGTSQSSLPSNEARGSAPSPESLFLDSLGPDYALVPQRARAARRRAGELYADACRGGNPDACWWARALLRDDTFIPRIAASCTAGHALSCRAMTLQPGLSFAQLREGCRAGLAEECVELAQTSTSTEDTLFAWERSCAIVRTTCHSAAEAFLEHDPIKARDLLELGCASVRTECVALAAAYLRGELVEPVPGRGRALYDHACGTPPSAGVKACEQGTSTPLVRPRIDI